MEPEEDFSKKLHERREECFFPAWADICQELHVIGVQRITDPLKNTSTNLGFKFPPGEPKSKTLAPSAQ